MEELPVTTANQLTQSKKYWEDQYGVSTLPLKTKPRSTVYSSGHYVSKPQLEKSGLSRELAGVCTQQIKPDSMCYSPAHYDRQNDIAARIKGLDLHSTAPLPQENHAVVRSVAENRAKMSENPNSRPSAPTRRIATSVYIPQSNSSSASQQANSMSHSRIVPTSSYDPTIYRSSDCRNGTQLVASRSSPKVYYAGNMALESRDRPVSPARSANEVDFGGRGYVERRPPNYVPAPPYNSHHHLKSHSTSCLPEDRFGSNSHGARPMNGRVIIDRPVCEKCQSVPIDRRQRFCAGCDQEVYRTHSTTTKFY